MLVLKIKPSQQFISFQIQVALKMSTNTVLPPLAVEEEIMKMRLLYDGDGVGDERRMNLLLKNVIKFAMSKDTIDQSVMETLLQRLLGQVLY